MVEQSQDVVRVAVDVVGPGAPRPVALAVAPVVEKDAPIRPGEGLGVPGRAPKRRVAAGPEMQQQWWALAFQLVAEPDAVGRRHEGH